MNTKQSKGFPSAATWTRAIAAQHPRWGAKRVKALVDQIMREYRDGPSPELVALDRHARNSRARRVEVECRTPLTLKSW